MPEKEGKKVFFNLTVYPSPKTNLKIIMVPKLAKYIALNDRANHTRLILKKNLKIL